MNQKDLAAAMEACILNTLNLTQFSKNSYEMIKNHYSLELIAEEYFKALN